MLGLSRQDPQDAQRVWCVCSYHCTKLPLHWARQSVRGKYVWSTAYCVSVIICVQRFQWDWDGPFVCRVLTVFNMFAHCVGRGKSVLVIRMYRVVPSCANMVGLAGRQFLSAPSREQMHAMRSPSLPIITIPYVPQFWTSHFIFM